MNCSQEAEKKIRLKRLPRVLTLHLKRFKYVESLDSFSKLSHRVVFPLELRTPNMTEGAGETDADGRLYRRELADTKYSTLSGPIIDWDSRAIGWD